MQDTFRDADQKFIIIPPALKTPETEEEKLEIIKNHHGDLASAHSGIKATLGKILENYTWKGTHKDVTEFINSCKMPLALTDTPRMFNEKIALDVVGPFTESLKGHKYVLTTQDQLSKFMEAVAMENQRAETIATALTNT